MTAPEVLRFKVCKFQKIKATLIQDDRRKQRKEGRIWGYDNGERSFKGEQRASTKPWFAPGENTHASIAFRRLQSPQPPGDTQDGARPARLEVIDTRKGQLSARGCRQPRGFGDLGGSKQGQGSHGSSQGVLLSAPARHEEDARPEGLTCSQGREDREGRGRGKRERRLCARALRANESLSRG